MPIMNGYEACQKMLEFYEIVNREKSINELENSQEDEQDVKHGVYLNLGESNESSTYQIKNWLKDLKLMYHAYLVRGNKFQLDSQKSTPFHGDSGHGGLIMRSA